MSTLEAARKIAIIRLAICAGSFVPGSAPRGRKLSREK
jgi:hypothetical protein